MSRSVLFNPAAHAAAVILLSSTTAFGVADVLILDSSVSGGLASLEAQTVINDLGLTVDIVSDAQWTALTAVDFAAYRCIIIGDPTCGGISPVVAGNACIWNAEVDGNVVIIGTDPTFHQSQGGLQLIKSGIAFAAADATKTGAYITLTCAYGGGAGTPVPELAGFCSPCDNSCFTVTGELGCYNDAHIVATSPALTGLTDADLSDWSCSVHEAFDGWPSDFIPLAIAEVAGGPYTASDGTVGFPYIMARGDVVPIGGCGGISNEEVLCDLDDSGSYTITFDLVNTSGVDVKYLLVQPPSGITVTPNVIVLPTPLADGDSTSVSLTFTGGTPGEEVCFVLSMNTSDFEECCALEHCFVVPDCACAQVHDESFECLGDGTDDFIYTFQVDNLTGDDIYHSYFIPVSPDETVITFDPNVVDYAPLPDNGTATVSVTIHGATAGEEICFLLTMHNASLDECCAIEVCIIAPDCNPCVIECPPDALFEDEPCDDSGNPDLVNGGCDTTPPLFTPISCGVTICGESWAVGTDRDTDWFELIIPAGAAAPVTMTVSAEFDVIFGYAEYLPGAEGSGFCGELTGKLNPVAFGEPCETMTITTPPLPGGVHWFFIAKDSPGGLPCSADNGTYVATWTCDLPLNPCDVDFDGVVGVNDLLILLSNWGSCCTGDINHDGVVNTLDLLLLLSSWG